MKNPTSLDYSKYLESHSPVKKQEAAAAEIIPVEPVAVVADTKALVIAGLTKVLADTFVLAALTQKAHWNVEGINFLHLHKEFGGEYEALADAVDDLAERIRQVGDYVQIDLAEFQRISGIDLGGIAAPKTDREWVAAVLAGHEKTLADLKALEGISGTPEFLEVQDLALARAQEHQKVIWFLKSVLK